jgi:hypothetical protein
MNCLTEEQLAQLALQLPDHEPLAAHAESCHACQAKLGDVRAITSSLTATHADLDRNHEALRARLLANLPAIRTSPRWPAATRWTMTVARLTPLQRLAAGSLGISTAAMLLFTALLIINAASPLSAMERMAKQLRQVTSFSFELEETSDRVTGENRRRILRNDTNFWRAPAYWHGTTKFVKIPLPADPNGANIEPLSNVEEIYTPGQRGILIDHLAKTFFRTPEMQPDSFPDYSPVNWMQRMSEGSVKVLDDLGTKVIDGKTAHGYVVSLGHPDPKNPSNRAELWLDPETDLPVEFRFGDTGSSDEIYSWTDEIRIYNCRWNIDLEDSFFEPIEPAGYDDTTWPTDADNAVEKIAQALRLYSKLSGGKYPQVTTFDGAAIHDEMMKLATAIAPTQTEAERKQTFQEIEQATAGLDWLTRILKNEHHTGYYGTAVGPTDTEKVLLWWPLDINDDYRVIYGDLRSEPLPLAEWVKLVPAEVSESHLPVHYTKPNADR